MAYPLEQGLKLDGNGLGAGVVDVLMAYPLEQGLKHIMPNWVIMNLSTS